MATFKFKLMVFLLLLAGYLSYTTTLYLTAPRQSHPPNALAQKGEMIWQQKNCTACHQLYGLGGHLGPDLTNVYAKRPEAYIRAFLKSGTNIMPDFHLHPDEIQALMEFLKYTNTTGRSSPVSFSTHIDGTISQSKED